MSLVPPTGVGATPTLLKLKTMKRADGKPLKIVQTVAAHDYATFGMCLLQDENGEEVALLKKNHIHDGAELDITTTASLLYQTADHPATLERERHEIRE